MRELTALQRALFGIPGRCRREQKENSQTAGMNRILGRVGVERKREGKMEDKTMERRRALLGSPFLPRTHNSEVRPILSRLLHGRSSSNIGHEGERCVVNELRSIGYEHTNWNTRLSGSTDIEAWTDNGNILIVQVKSAVYPNRPAELTAEEERNIVLKAKRLGGEAYLAQVQLDLRLNQVGRIRWTKQMVF